MVKFCVACGVAKASVKRPSTHEMMCKECFFHTFEEEVHRTITTGKLFKRGETVAVAVSGGKDSTVLAHVMTTLNKRHDYGLDLRLLAIDEGITGYRDDSLETVKRNEQQYEIPLKICSYKELYGWTMDEIVKAIGKKNNCTFCGVFRRQALDRGAFLVGATKICTGHNADDCAETVLMNILRGDVARLSRCADLVTGREGDMPRCKPLMYSFEKEIVMYAQFKKLDYFCTECIYSPNAYRGHARDLIKRLEVAEPQILLDIIHSAQFFASAEGSKALPAPGICKRCGFISSNEICKACVMLEGLNQGVPELAISNARKQRQLFSKGEQKRGRKGKAESDPPVESTEGESKAEDTTENSACNLNTGLS
uniref:Cytoplasmic tRNA 2-thiolation protein 1 n=1 Tax=Chromera velia CCMP2878 TaxID=1169474 RepID=A0A0G4HAG8_9ALVE|mmetsp:Transcript_36857/g.72474  ORF Transcript_36857/g.72474 Transcript_36857/m.72474 type:complete len:368 (+) Transcript_36857:154-1257(+)|eukprot:Cvel_25535.t1-p1 / transcript=Cvel_25535.t1 / gene=Cvel_25535 / organism=Chromera_velia_CCMP2878 / gene_product=Cytoplasmic tRNA 2-thiolation protein 1, putative / transcript_product=Cytoplasmic tRNA 2-thiolation protein 1, putative / location=Cvel_scaffold2905:13338-17937(-) / protein_length=367 / sequence_SO=supercontig / SO=protein_coding / is_pseudo=false